MAHFFDIRLVWEAGRDEMVKKVKAREQRDDVRVVVAGLRDLQARIRLASAARLSDREVRAAIEKGRG